MAPNNLIANFEKTKTKLEDLKFLINFAKLVHNEHVYACYSGSGEINDLAKKGLLIRDTDNLPTIAIRILLFFLSLQKLEHGVTDIVAYAKGYKPTEPDILFGRVKLNPSKKYDEEKRSIGCRYVKVPHIDEAKIADLHGFSLAHGNVTRLYSFADGKQIKVKVISVTEGDRVINQLLKIVKKDWVIGSSEEHSFTGDPPKDVKDHKLKGITSRGTAIHLNDNHSDLYTIFLKQK
jgi:hypothetical protein